MTALALASHGSRVDSALRIAAVTTVLTFVALLNCVPVASNDLWLQTKIGQMIMETGEIPRTVLFPFTWVRDNIFNAHEWLPSIFFHLFDRSLGRGGLLFVQGAFGLAQFGLSFVLARRLSGSLAVALILAAMAMLVANYRYHLRPEVFALLLLVGLLYVLTIYREHGDWRVLLWSVFIAVVWANSHGSFALGPVVASIYAVGEATEWVRRNSEAAPVTRLRGATRAAAPYALVAVAMTLASILNPLGVGLLQFVLELSGSEVTKTFINEWRPTMTQEFMSGKPFAIFITALAATLAVMAAFRRRVTATDVLLMAAFTFLAFQRTRFVVLFGFVALLVCARLIGGWVHRQQWERTLLAACTGAATVGTAVVVFFGNVWGAYPFAVPTSNFTEPMIDLLSRPSMKGNVFNSYELGAELIYRTYPRLRPSMDSRIDSYGDRYFLLQQQLLVDEPLMKDFVAEFDVRYMLLSWRDFNLVKKMDGLRQGWQMEFADHKAVLLARKP
jgi:Dolichyl-phosphate-mannose-protein mannosyltransferase